MQDKSNEVTIGWEAPKIIKKGTLRKATKKSGKRGHSSHSPVSSPSPLNIFSVLSLSPVSTSS